MSPSFHFEPVQMSPPCLLDRWFGDWFCEHGVSIVDLRLIIVQFAHFPLRFDARWGSGDGDDGRTISSTGAQGFIFDERLSTYSLTEMCPAKKFTVRIESQKQAWFRVGLKSADSTAVYLSAHGILTKRTGSQTQYCLIDSETCFSPFIVTIIITEHHLQFDMNGKRMGIVTNPFGERKPSPHVYVALYKSTATILQDS